MKYIKYIILGVLLYSCEPKEIEEIKEYEWKDISIHSVDVDWRSIQMLDENTGYIGGTHKFVSVEDTTIIEMSQLLLDTIFYNAHSAKYITEPEISTPFLYKTENGAADWKPISTPFKTGIIQLQFLDENIGFVSTFCEGVFKTLNGGTSWERLLSGTIFGRGNAKGGYYSFYFINNNTGYAKFEGSVAFTLKTVDGGKTWEEIEYHGLIIFPQNEIGFAYNRSQVYKTIDNGKIWIPINKDLSPIYDMYFVSQSVFYILSSYKIHETFDAGETWNTYQTSLNAPKLIVVQNQDVYCYNEQKISRTSINQPLNHQIMSQELNDEIYDFSFPNPQLGFAVGNNGMILRYQKE